MSNEQKDSHPEKHKTMSMRAWIAIGVAIGAGIGIALDNLPLDTGVAIVTPIGAAQTQKSKDR